MEEEQFLAQKGINIRSPTQKYGLSKQYFTLDLATNVTEETLLWRNNCHR